MRKKKNRFISFLLSILMLVTTIAPLGGSAAATVVSTKPVLAVDFLKATPIMGGTNHDVATDPDGSVNVTLKANRTTSASPFDKNDGVYFEVDQDVDVVNNPYLYFSVAPANNAMYSITLFYDMNKSGVITENKYYQLATRYPANNGQPFMQGALTDNFDIIKDYLFDRYDTSTGIMKIRGILVSVVGNAGDTVTFKTLGLGAQPLEKSTGFDNVYFAIQDPYYDAQLTQGETYGTNLFARDSANKHINLQNANIEYVCEPTGAVTVNENGEITAVTPCDFKLTANITLGSTTIFDYVSGKISGTATAKQQTYEFRVMSPYRRGQSTSRITAPVSTVTSYDDIPVFMQQLAAKDWTGSWDPTSDDPEGVPKESDPWKFSAESASGDFQFLDEAAGVGLAKENTWGSVQIKVDAAGEYDLSTRIRQSKDYGCASEVYFAPASDAANRMDSKYLVASFNAYNVDESTQFKYIQLGTKSLEAGDYIVTYKVNNKISGASLPHTYVQKFVITPASEVVAKPAITPGFGTFTDTQQVSIECNDATIHYTTDGSIPTSLSPTYSAPISINDTTTIKAIGTKTGAKDSEVAEVTLTKTNITASKIVATAPTIDGTINANEWVLTKEMQQKSNIDGQTDYNSSDTGKFDVKWDEQYIYVAALVENHKGTLVNGTGWTAGDFISIYFSPQLHKGALDTTKGDVQIGIGYNDAENADTPNVVLFGSGESAAIPTEVQNALKSGGIKQHKLSDNSWSIEAKFPLSALKINPSVKKDFGFNIDIENNAAKAFTHWAAEGTHVFWNNTAGFGKVTLADPVKADVPTAIPFNGYNFVDPINVTLKAENGAKIYYTTDGSTPTVSSTLYSAPIPVSNTTTIKAFASIDGCINSDIVSFTYTKVAATKDPLVYDFRVVAPAASGGTGTTPIVNVKDYKYVLDKNASLTKLSPSAPWCFGAKMDDATNFVAGAADLGVGINTAGKWASFRINVPQSGNYKTSIHFWDSPDPRYIGELNYYFNPVSTNNPIDETGKIGTYDMKPATGSMKTLDLVESKYIEAGEYYFTVKLGTNGYAWMAQLILAPVVTATPTITPNGGILDGSEEVTLACDTTDAKIYYTTDGTDPSASSTEYTAAFSIDKACTVKAIAISPTLGNSKVASATFTAPTGFNPYHPVPALTYVENMVALNATTAPTVDGNLSEWTLDKPLSELGKTDATTSKFNMTWDDTYVYIAADIKRAGALVAPTFTDGKMATKGTHASFFFDPAAHQGLFTNKIGDKTGLQLGDIQISVSYNPTDATKAYITFGGGGPFAKETEIVANSKAALKANAAGDGFAVEVAFRWEDLMITPKVDEYFAFELFDEDNLKWASNGKAEEFWNKSDNFGKVTLAAAKELKSVWFAVKDNLDANLVQGTTYDTELKLFADLGQEDQITDTTGKSVVYKVTTAAAEDPSGASSTIATVDATTGKITAVSAGTCKIWATVTLNGKSATDVIGATIAAPPATAVTLSTAVADGTSNTTTSTKITFTFDKAITGLTADSFTITNGTGTATKGALTGSGTTYTLAITPTKEGTVSVAVANPTGFTISGSPKTVTVYYKTPAPAKELKSVWFAVKDNYDAELVTGSSYDTELKLFADLGQEDQITDTTGKTVVYKVTTDAATDPNGTASTIATVDAATGKITAVSAGTCKIWATVTLNGKSATDVIGSTITAPEKVATPSANPVAGTYTSARNVTLTCATTGAEIYYTTNGDTPTTSSTKYTAAIPVSATTTIKAIAIKSGLDNSNVATFVYTITVAPQKVAAPTANPAAGSYTSAQNVTLTCATAGAEIYYTTNGSAPTTSSTKYTTAIPVSTTTTIKAIAVKSGMTNSDVASLVYTINNNPNKVVAPTANPVSGTSFKDTIVVNLAAATVGSTIYYTTDGTIPTTASTKYTTSIILSKTTTIKAIAIKSGMDNSDVATFTYTKGAANQVETPTTDLVPGLGFTSAISIRLNCNTIGAKIYYTLDGSIPTTSSHEYEGRAIILTNTTTIKAIAVKDGMTDSIIMIAPYMLVSPTPDNRPINKPSKPDTDPVIPPTTAEPTTANTTTSVDVNDEGVASVTASQKDLADSLKNAKEVAKKNGTTANGIELQLNVKTDKEADKIDVQISEDALNTITSKDVKTFNIVSDNIKVGFDAAAIAEVKKQTSGNVNFSISKVDAKDLSPEAAKMVGTRPVVDLKMGDVSNFGQGKVHVAIPYKLAANENADEVHAAYINKDGKVEILSDSAYNKETGCVEFYTGHFSIYGVVKVAKAPEFKDTTNHWAKDDIAFVATQGILGGTGKDVFSPDMSMTRGMFVTALGRLAGADITGFTTSSFNDVQSGKYYLPYIEWAVKNGIVRGIGNGKFAPDKAITREEMAVIMANYAKAMGINLQAKNAEIKFADNASISAWAIDAVKAMQTAGIIGGKNNNKFDPKGTATRAEVSAVLKRFMELVGA